MAGKLRGKIALITGASSGLGLADAIEFVKEGASQVIMVSQDKVRLEEAAEIVKKYGDTKISTFAMDVTSESDWERLVERLTDKVEKLDILVNNAGINKRDTFQQATLEDWNRIIAVNQTGVFLGMKNCLSLLKKSGKASIINLSSITGMTGYFAVAYTATKWAVRGMTKSAALEFGPYGIRVNSVNPGYIETPLNESIKELIEATKPMNPLGRAGQAEEIAKAVAFLASEESSYMTGAELVLDGGLTSGGQFKMVADEFKLY